MLMNDEYQPINCDDYDNLELACQHKLILKLELRDGEVIEAKAIDLLQKKRVEYLTIPAPCARIAVNSSSLSGMATFLDSSSTGYTCACCHSANWISRLF